MRWLSVLGFATSALAVGLVGQGCSDSTTSITSDAGTAKTDSGTITDDGGSVSPGDGGAGDAAEVASDGTLSVTVLQLLTASVYSGSATAAVVPTPAGGASTTCTASDDGTTCHIIDCPAPVISDAGTVDAGSDAGVAAVPNAGDLTITGAKSGTITLSWNSTTQAYGLSSLSSQAFATGDTLTLAAAGDTIPAFSGKTAVAPSTISLTSPTANGDFSYTFDHAAKFDVAWSAGDAGASGNVNVTLTGKKGDHTVLAVCTFDAAAGSGSIPATTTAKFDAPSGTNSTVSVSTTSGNTFTSGNWGVNFTLSTFATSGLLKAP